jgi:hypothetical protein
MIESVEVPSSAADVVVALGGGAIIVGGTSLMPKINNEAFDGREGYPSTSRPVSPRQRKNTPFRS